ncbi:MAG: hypothetical protein Kow0020_05710 [Wenzhouxiangellaceae bacterium]
MLADLLAAFALMLVIEGLMPTISPEGWRGLVRQLAELSDASIRAVGIGMLLAGAVLFHLAR